MLSQEKIKVGVIGVGALGRHHARLYKQSPNADVIGIYDVSSETAKKVADEFALTAFNDMNELADKCDALSIAVPATKHYESAIPILKMKKHLLIEKPIAAKVEEAEHMVSLAKENNLVLGVGHVERFNPAMNYLEKMAANTRFVEAHRLASYPPQRPGLPPRGTEVGVVLDLMIHDLDLVLNMIKCDVEKFDAVGIPVLSGTEDIASVRIKFVNGSVANLTASRVSLEPMRKFRVFQTDSYITMDYANHTGAIIQKKSLGLVKKDLSLDQKNALQEELEDFLSAVRQTMADGKIHEPKVPGWQGLKALDLAVKISSEIIRYNDSYNIKFK